MNIDKVKLFAKLKGVEFTDLHCDNCKISITPYCQKLVDETFEENQKRRSTWGEACGDFKI